MDKVLHFIAGMAVFFTVQIGTDGKLSGLWTMAPVGAVAVSKELYDTRKGGSGFDGIDAAATVAGGLTAWGIKELVTR